MATPAASLTDRPPEPTAEEIRDDVAEALRDQGFKPVQAHAAAVAARGNTFSEMFKSGLEWLHKARSSGMNIEQTERKTMKPEKAAADPKICRGYRENRCDRELGPKNTTGLCSRCYGLKNYHEKGKAARSSRTSRTSRTSKSSRTSRPAQMFIDRERVALEVTESQLDRFLTKLPIADKIKLANHYLTCSEEI